ncbi:MAG: 3-hydroxyacyl-CoA dehydrogenase NAD-binding domain-containing protein [Steroidobacteraceae bacterium]
MSGTPSWKYAQEAEGIIRLTLDKADASTNVLSRDVMLGLEEMLDMLAKQRPVGVIICSAKSSGFIAGADINEFVALQSKQEAYELVRGAQRSLDRLENLPCPSVCQIFGFALGGGLELALACTYRVAAQDGRLALGFPEVQLGIHPGFGGTVRAVRILGVRPAMDMMLTGKTIRGDKALRIGLIDCLVVPADLDSASRALVANRPARRRAPWQERLLSAPLVRSVLKPALLRQVHKHARQDHYPAPYAIVDLWARHGGRGQSAYEAEARSIANLFVTETSRNLVRLFFLQSRLKVQGARASMAVRRVHVVGAGVMGGDIAAWCALRGLEVTLQDRTLEGIQPAIQRARESWSKRLGAAEASAAMARLRADVNGEGVSQADLVIEAIFENLEAKRSLYAQLEPRMPMTSILASNTSSIPLEELASGLADPGRFVGLHFFNPVAQMLLVEVVAAARTRPEILNSTIACVRRFDKLPIVCRSAPGFLVNRVLAPYLQEAMLMLEQGLAPEVVDAAAVHFGMAMGPIEMADVVGLDVCKHVGEIVNASLGRAPPLPLTRLEERVATKKLGRKSGEGFYVWEGTLARKAPVTQPIPPDLEDRLVLALVNEAVACQRERIVSEADFIDAALVFGAGFAPFRGGPLHYARQRGVAECVARLTQLEQAQGERFTPDAGWSVLQPPAA